MMTLSAAPRNSSAADTVLTLPTHTDAVAVAEACRDAGLAFLNESSRWGKAELAMWLMGTYAPLTQHHGSTKRRRSGQFAVVRPITELRQVDGPTIQRVIREARAEVMAALESTRTPEGGASFAFSMMSSGFVARCEDARGWLGWLPTTAAQRLADRVLSLFAVDYLTRPTDYETAPSTCSCGAVAFESAWCSHRSAPHRRATGTLAPRLRQSTLPYLMVGA